MNKLNEVLAHRITEHPTFRVKFVASNIVAPANVQSGEIVDVIVNQTAQTIYVWCFK